MFAGQMGNGIERNLHPSFHGTMLFMTLHRPSSRQCNLLHSTKPGRFKNMKKKLVLMVAGLAMAGVLSVVLPSAIAQETTPPTAVAPGAGHPAGHPNIRRALHALEAAETDLKAAPHDFGGHREDALAACDKAIEQLKICLKYPEK